MSSTTRRIWHSIYNDVNAIHPGDKPIRTYNLCVVGFGNVGRALVALLQRKRHDLSNCNGIEWRLTGVASRRLGGWLRHRASLRRGSGRRFHRGAASR